MISSHSQGFYCSITSRDCIQIGLHSIFDKDRSRKSTLTDACLNSLFHTVFVESVVAGPKGAPSGFEYSGNHLLGMPH